MVSIAVKEKRGFVKDELPYLLLIEMYKDCRQSLRELSKKFDVSYHTVAKTLSELESSYGLAYTLSLDEHKLGFSEARVISIKFKEKPPADVLMKSFVNSIFVQDAYLASGDFDLLMYVVGLSPYAFGSWQFTLRMQLSRYGALPKISTFDEYGVGFFPLKTGLLEKSPVLSDVEKRILKVLNENSRLSLKKVSEKSKTTRMQVIHTIKKLKRNGTIKSFSALTQKPEKRLWLSYCTLLVAPHERHVETFTAFVKELLKEDLHSATNDYCMLADVNGAYDSVAICTFEDGEQMASKGYAMRKRLWDAYNERPKIKSAILTDAVIGRWPFHLERYENYAKIAEDSEKGPGEYPYAGPRKALAEGLDLIDKKSKKRTSRRPRA